jgi:hypothetical protein
MEVRTAIADAVKKALATCINSLEIKLDIYSAKKIDKALEVLKGSLFDDEYMAPIKQHVHPLEPMINGRLMTREQKRNCGQL